MWGAIVCRVRKRHDFRRPPLRNNEDMCICRWCETKADDLIKAAHRFQDGVCPDCGTEAASWIRSRRERPECAHYSCEHVGLSHRRVPCACELCGDISHDMWTLWNRAADQPCLGCSRCGHTEPHSWLHEDSCSSCGGTGSVSFCVYMAPRDPEGHGHEFDRHETATCSACDGQGWRPVGGKERLSCYRCHATTERSCAAEIVAQ